MPNSIVLTWEGGQYKAHAGDLYGLTPGSILAVESPAGLDGQRKLLGHVRVRTTRPLDATVVPCEYEGTPLAHVLPPLSTCRPVYIDFGLRRFELGHTSTEGRARGASADPGGRPGPRRGQGRVSGPDRRPAAGGLDRTPRSGPDRAGRGLRRPAAVPAASG